MKRKKDIRAKIYLSKHEANECVRAEIAKAIEGSCLKSGEDLARRFLSLTADDMAVSELVKHGEKFNILFY